MVSCGLSLEVNSLVFVKSSKLTIDDEPSFEIIVTFDYSDTILGFLIEGSKDRDFEVIVVCCNNKHECCHKMVNY